VPACGSRAEGLCCGGPAAWGSSAERAATISCLRPPQCSGPHCRCRRSRLPPTPFPLLPPSSCGAAAPVDMSRRGATNGSAEIKRVPLLRVTSAVRACGGAAGTTCRRYGHTCRSWLPAACALLGRQIVQRRHLKVSLVMYSPCAGPVPVHGGPLYRCNQCLLPPLSLRAGVAGLAHRPPVRLLPPLRAAAAVPAGVRGRIGWSAVSIKADIQCQVALRLRY